MKKMRLNKDRRAISELVSYVLLITLTIAIASGTFVWLKSIAQPPKTVECPDVSLWLVNSSCYGTSNNADGSKNTGNITFFLQNKGRIDINGFRIQISENAEDAKMENFKVIDTSGVLSERCNPSYINNTYYCRINSSQTVEVFGIHWKNTAKLIKITPMKRIENQDAYCSPVYFQIDCVESFVLGQAQ